MRNNRTKAVMVNSSLAVSAQLVNLILNFVVRTLLIKSLGSEVNGLNGLFSNVVNILSFAELGIGSAISYSLYKPLAEGDQIQISAIMQLFKKIYDFVATFVAVVGIIISFFITVFIHGDNHGVGNVQIAFLLFISNVVFSYLMSYKRTLLIANQQGYIDSLNRMLFTFISQLVQIIGLIFFPNYYLFLVIQSLTTVVSNLPILKRVKSDFPFLNTYRNSNVDSKTIKYLKKNVAGMLSFKMGNIIILGTDNILLSSFLGLNVVGMYANYTLIITGFTTLMNSLVNSITSSIGNLASDGNEKKERKVFLQFNMVNSVLAFTVGMGLITFFPIFIKLWLGTKFVLTDVVTFIIVMNFFVAQLRNGLINYLNAYGLYWEQRYKSFFEATTNLIVSLVLITQTNLGIEGVLVGTLTAYLLVDFVWEPKIVMNYAIKVNLKAFYTWYGSQILFGAALFYFAQMFTTDFLLDSNLLLQVFVIGIQSIVFALVFYLLQKFVARAVRLDVGNFKFIFNRLKHR